MACGASRWRSPGWSPPAAAAASARTPTSRPAPTRSTSSRRHSRPSSAWPRRASCRSRSATPATRRSPTSGASRRRRRPFAAFAEASEQPGLADPSRPVWVVDDGPTGGTTAYTNTGPWAAATRPDQDVHVAGHRGQVRRAHDQVQGRGRPRRQGQGRRCPAATTSPRARSRSTCRNKPPPTPASAPTARSSPARSP